MLGPHFYNQAIHKTVVGFGTLFNNIEIQKKDPTSGNILEAQKVPFAYGPRSKFLTRIEQDPDPGPGRPYENVILPRMYFEMVNISYDSSRKTSPIQKYKSVISNNGEEIKVQYVPIPYNIEFELGILAKSQDDGLQILEQIIPYFQPNFNITINFIPDMSEKKDVQIILNTINYEDDWEGTFINRRLITWTLSFTAKTYVYGPFNQASVIKKAIVYESASEFPSTIRNSRLTYTPKALTDKNNDNVINTQDDLLLISTDDFGFNEEIVIYE